MKSILCAIAVAFVLAFQVPGDWVSQWGSQWALLHIALGVWVCAVLRANVHWSVALLVAVLMASGVNASQWTLISREASVSLLGLSLVLLFFSAMGNRSIVLELGFSAFMLSSLYTLFTQNKLGFMANESMNGCLIAMTMPLAMMRAGSQRTGGYDLVADLQVIMVLLLGVSTVLFTGEATPIMMLAGMVIADVLASRAWGRLIWIIVPLGLGYLVQGDQLWAPRGRIEYWKTILSWWWDSGKHWFGMGLGSGQVIFPLEGIAANARKWVFWAHNDYVQAVFELGLVGAGALIVAIVSAAWRSRSRPLLFQAVVGVAVMMMFNSPFHHAVTAFFGAAILWLVYERDGTYT